MVRRWPILRRLLSSEWASSPYIAPNTHTHTHTHTQFLIQLLSCCIFFWLEILEFSDCLMISNVFRLLTEGMLVPSLDGMKPINLNVILRIEGEHSSLWGIARTPLAPRQTQTDPADRFLPPGSFRPHPRQRCCPQISPGNNALLCSLTCLLSPLSTRTSETIEWISIGVASTDSMNLTEVVLVAVNALSINQQHWFQYAQVDTIIMRNEHKQWTQVVPQPLNYPGLPSFTRVERLSEKESLEYWLLVNQMSQTSSRYFILFFFVFVFWMVKLWLVR